MYHKHGAYPFLVDTMDLSGHVIASHLVVCFSSHYEFFFHIRKEIPLQSLAMAKKQQERIIPCQYTTTLEAWSRSAPEQGIKRDVLLRHSSSNSSKVITSLCV